MKLHPFVSAFLALAFIIASTAELEQRTDWTVSLVLFVIGLVFTISFVKGMEREETN